MGKFSLNVLDKYAKTLSESQIGKLYESKMGKKYERHLNEDKHYHTIYLDEFTIINELDMNKMEFAIDLNENHRKELDNVFYKILDEGIMFKTEDENAFKTLRESFIEMGIDEKSIDDEK